MDVRIAEVKREIAMRQKVYPKWIEAGSLQKSKDNFQILAAFQTRQIGIASFDFFSFACVIA